MRRSSCAIIEKKMNADRYCPDAFCLTNMNMICNCLVIKVKARQLRCSNEPFRLFFRRSQSVSSVDIRVDYLNTVSWTNKMIVDCLYRLFDSPEI